MILQSDALAPYSTVVAAPTSASAPAALWRPEVRVGRQRTRVLTDQLRTVDRGRLGRCVGRLAGDELSDVEDALRAVLGLL